MTSDQTVPYDSESRQWAERLVDSLRPFSSLLIAFSGGVDSSVVAAAAAKAKGRRAVAVTAVSASVSQRQLEWAARVAKELQIEHHTVATTEGDLAEYRRNDGNRCYYCKQTLYQTLTRYAQQFGFEIIVSGTNADDLGDYRPGLLAGAQWHVRTPLADLGMDKSIVRRVAQLWGLSNAQLPASPCLASRIAYGVEVTPERLSMVEQGEQWLRNLGFVDLRVRLHEGALARIEVPLAQLERLLDADVAKQLDATFKELGFRFVTIDLAGLQSGSLNQLVQINTTLP